MAQAKTLSQTELDLVLNYVSTKKYALRDRALILTSFLGGLRVAEIASLKMGDVLNLDGTIKNEIRLSAAQTKGKHPRTVFVSQRLQTELANYLTTRHIKEADIPFFHTDHRLGFSANGLCVWFYQLYKNVGISGGSSHSGRKFFITTLANKGIGVRILASLASDQPHIDLDSTKIRKVLGWKPTVKLEDGLTRTIEYWKKKLAA